MFLLSGTSGYNNNVNCCCSFNNGFIFMRWVYKPHPQPPAWTWCWVSSGPSSETCLGLVKTAPTSIASRVLEPSSPSARYQHRGEGGYWYISIVLYVSYWYRHTYTMFYYGSIFCSVIYLSRIYNFIIYYLSRLISLMKTVRNWLMTYTSGLESTAHRFVLNKVCHKHILNK